MKLAPDFPSLADEISEPRPDNIKVAAFTVSGRSINTRRVENNPDPVSGLGLDCSKTGYIQVQHVRG